MSGKLSGKVAVVTGSARGIGKAICEKLASEGAAVVVVDINAEAVEATASEFRSKGIDSIGVAANVAKFEDAEKAVAKVIEKYGHLDILANNAGITRDGLMLRMSDADWDAVLAVNLKGVFNFTKAAVRPMMKQRYGRIVNTASVVGRMGNAGQANYSASKAGVIALTKTTAKEFASRGINVNAIAPGYIETDMTKVLPQESRDLFLKFIPLKRAGTPQDVANVVYFFCSPEADYVTGQVLNVDGGFLM